MKSWSSFDRNTSNSDEGEIHLYDLGSSVLVPIEDILYITRKPSMNQKLFYNSAVDKGSTPTDFKENKRRKVDSQESKKNQKESHYYFRRLESDSLSIRKSFDTTREGENVSTQLPNINRFR